MRRTAHAQRCAVQVSEGEAEGRGRKSDRRLPQQQLTVFGYQFSVRSEILGTDGRSLMSARNNSCLSIS
jgi:hypothetical protein